VQVNLQIHSWAEENGYRWRRAQRGLMLKSRKPGDPHPFVDPDTFRQWVKSQDNAARPFSRRNKPDGDIDPCHGEFIRGLHGFRGLEQIGRRRRPAAGRENAQSA
jgi:hypothetical protein